MSKTAEDLYAHLFATLEAVRAGGMELDRARAVCEISREITNLAKAETDHARVTGSAGSRLLNGADDALTLPAPANGIVAVRRHLLRDG